MKHTYFVWTVSTCLVRWDFLGVVYEHIVQACILVFLWICLICRVTCDLRAELNVQPLKVHLKGRTWWCTAAMWCNILDLDAEAKSQIEQLYGFNFKWTVSIWRVSIALRLVQKLQVGQENGLGIKKVYMKI